MNKKGSGMVEAALVFPMMIMSLATIILIISFLFQEIQLQSQLHTAAIDRSGEMTETGGLDNLGSEYLFSKQWVLGASRLNGTVSLPTPVTALLNKQSEHQIRCRIYLTDETTYRRYVNLLREKGEALIGE